VGPATASELRAAGYGTFDAIRAATVDDLGSVENVSESDAESFKEQLGSE
jgi:predicted flap endonuclease-1-like 5' DNA nuclease